MNNSEFVLEISKLRPSSTFLSIMGYRNSASEIADYSIVFNMSYESALRKSIAVLENTITTGDLQNKAKKELIDGYSKSLENISAKDKVDNTYTLFYDQNNKPIKGIKLHNATNTLHLYGLVNWKKVIMPGIYSKNSKKELTIIKDKLRKLTPLGKFRQFKITPDQVDRISVQNLNLLPPNV